jgi:hypothetical protein
MVFSTGAAAVPVTFIPHEFAIGEVYFPPLLIAAVLGVLAAVLSAQVLNRYRLSRYFFYPPLVFLSLSVVYTILFGTFLIPG